MVAILGSLIGFVSSLGPAIVKIFQDKQDKKHELLMLDKQIEMQKLFNTQRLAEVETAADMEEIKALYQDFSPKTTSIKFVDGFLALLNSSVRPVITYAFFSLYTWVKYAQYQITPDVLQLWSEEDMAIFCAVISYWFGQRALARYMGMQK